MSDVADLDQGSAARHYVILYDASGKIAHVHQHLQFDGRTIDADAIESEAKRIASTIAANKLTGLSVLHAVELPKLSLGESMRVDVINQRLTVIPRLTLQSNS